MSLHCSIRKAVICSGLLLAGRHAMGQSMMGANAAGGLNTATRDTNLNKSNTNKWRNTQARVTFEKLGTQRQFAPDTSIHTFQRPVFATGWRRDLGNLGTAVNNLLFVPEARTGPTLGYHVADAYRFIPDSLNFYNTTRPYTEFSYRMGSKLEQTAGITHTQNATPNLNFAFDYRKTTSPGYYKIQRSNHDNAALTAIYKSPGKHYSLYGAVVYNLEQMDENGGILREADLQNPDLVDRKTIHTTFESQYSIKRSSVTNRMRDLTAMVQHSYAFGYTDTLYNEDSTRYSLKLAPRFSITHKATLGSEQHTYKDLTPDSMWYVGTFSHPFLNNGNGYFTTNGGDSVYSVQQWFYIDNRVLLNGFIGPRDKAVKFSAGAGARYDRFATQPLATLVPDSLPKQVYTVGYDRSKIASTYLAGELQKEAMQPGQWDYRANVQFYLTGPYVGNLALNAALSKGIGKAARFTAGFAQNINSAPYNYLLYGNQYTRLERDYDLETVNTLHATVESPVLKLAGGVRNYVITNFIYVSREQHPGQYAGAFTITQAWLNKVFRVGRFYLDNEMVLQQRTADAPVNIPLFMGRHQLSFETNLFHSAMKLATGVAVRYNTPYNPAGYSAMLNRFFYQDSYQVTNVPECSAFINFKVKRFRAYIQADQLQQLAYPNAVLYVGPRLSTRTDPATTYTPVYPTTDMILRFGFNWALTN